MSQKLRAARRGKATPALQQTQARKPKQSNVGQWFLCNMVLLFVMWIFAKALLGSGQPPMSAEEQNRRPDFSCHWLWKDMLPKNFEIAKQFPDASYDERQAMKLGVDYKYLLLLRQATPEDAVIYYPTRGDFQADGNPLHFSGQLIDKLTAVRVLYPRRVVTEDEWEAQTSWAKRLTHVAVVNYRNLDKLPYRVDSAAVPNGVRVLPCRMTNALANRN